MTMTLAGYVAQAEDRRRTAEQELSAANAAFGRWRTAVEALGGEGAADEKMLTRGDAIAAGCRKPKMRSGAPRRRLLRPGKSPAKRTSISGGRRSGTRLTRPAVPCPPTTRCTGLCGPGA
jgi:hypothetical protein